MKKLLLFLLLFTGITNAQIVNIPDANFKAKLLQASVNNQIASTSYTEFEFGIYPQSFNKIDINNDGQIQYSEVQNIQFLNIAFSAIFDLTGIEAFVNLKELDCGQNYLASINLSQNTVLREFYGFDTGLTSLNVSQNPNLRCLECASNQISSLNLSQNLLLKRIDCTTNLLTSLNVLPLQELEYLKCGFNQLTSLNVSGLANLKYLICYYNSLTSLNLTGAIKLLDLECYDNLLTDINFSSLNSIYEISVGNPGFNSLSFNTLGNNSGLDTLSFIGSLETTIDLSILSNLRKLTLMNTNLVSIDVSQNSKVYNFSIYNCPNLSSINLKNGRNNTFSLVNCPSLDFICVDEIELVSTQNELTSEGANSVVCNSYCSFTPGGNFNTITGSIVFDGNANGCEVTDLPRPNIKIDINDGANQGATYTNSSGNYNFYTGAGSFTITPNVENLAWFTIAQTSAIIPFANNNNNTTTQNFCITPNGIHPDLEIVIVPISPARPGFDAVYKIVYKNKGNQTLSGNVNFQYNDTNLDFVSSTIIPSSQSTGNLVWDYTNLMPFESRSVNVTLNVNSPMETPAVNIGDVLNFTAAANPVSGDETTSDNTFQYNQTVVGAFDPNDKTCLEGNVVSPTKIGDYLHYNINFENTGTFQAENIVVKDVIDVAKFDINTLRILDASHPVTTRVSGSKTEFIFENIDLGASQKGNVVFKIKTKSNLVVGNSVSNKANIYFDYNFPIETNTATTAFQALSNSSFTRDESISIYPNPTKNKINIKSDNVIKSIELFDVQGRVLITKMASDYQEILDISDKTNGIYFLRITSENGSKVEKLIKE